MKSLMLKQLQYYLMQRADSLKQTLMLGKMKSGKEKGWQMRRLDSITDMSLSKSRDSEVLQESLYMGVAKRDTLATNHQLTSYFPLGPLVNREKKKVERETKFLALDLLLCWHFSLAPNYILTIEIMLISADFLVNTALGKYYKTLRLSESG